MFRTTGEQARRRAEGRHKGVRAKPKRLNFTLRDTEWRGDHRGEVSGCVFWKDLSLAGRLDRMGTPGGWGPSWESSAITWARVQPDRAFGPPSGNVPSGKWSTWIALVYLS